MPPPAQVIAAFGETGTPRPLRGGQRTVWRLRDTVFKRLDTSVAAIAWQGEVLDGLSDEVRTAPPRTSRDGRWVVDDWTAWRYERGSRVPGAWPAIASAGRALHRALADVPAPAWVDARDDPWARADRAAWADELPATALATPLVAELAERRRPLDPAVFPPQLAHTDLSGNVLFAAGAAPLVLDVSLCRRPAPYASAVVAVDAMLWEGANAEVLDEIAAGESAAARADFAQFALRAVMFRLLAARLARPGTDPAALRAEFAAVTARVARRCG